MTTSPTPPPEPPPAAPRAPADVLARLRDPRGARAVVVGAGKTGACAARLLLQLRAQVTVVDDAPLEKAQAGLEKHGLARGAVELVAGGIDAARVRDADLVVLSPGVPRAHPAIAAAIEAGAAVVNELELGAAQLPGCAFIGITGTNGKSTTTTMLGAIAHRFAPGAADGAPPGASSGAPSGAFVGGNLGTPLCAALVEGARPIVGVIELSSYQLETIAHLPLRAAIVTNLAPDHLDRYPSAEAYYAAKARIFGLVVRGGGVSLNARDPVTAQHLRPPASLVRCDFDVDDGAEGIAIVHGAAGPVARARFGAARDELALANPRIVGHHNRQNAAAAIAAALLTSMPVSCARDGLADYAGIEHRLERIGAVRDVAWFNDSKATNVDAAVTALTSFTGGVHLIAGGLGKGAPYAPLVEAARGRVVAVYTIGQDAPALRAAFEGHAALVDAGTLERAVDDAMARAKPGDVVLLSPACASFDQFRDYGHRGQVMRDLFAARGGVAS